MNSLAVNVQLNRTLWKERTKFSEFWNDLHPFDSKSEMNKTPQENGEGLTCRDNLNVCLVFVQKHVIDFVF